MKRILTLVLCWLLTFESFGATTFKAKTSVSVAGGYVTSLNKVDGSFEDGSTQWSASVGTIVPTASTEFQGNYKGVWAGTGTGTLDLQWTATASNTFEATAQVNVNGEDDVYVCAYVGTTETGCKLIPALNKIQKVSVVADSVISSAFYLRLKHTGSDAFSVEVDDGKIEPYTLNTVNLTKEDIITYSGSNGWDASNRAYFKTLDPLSHYGETVTATNSSYTKFTILQPCDAKLSVAGSMVNISGITLKHFSASGIEKHSVYTYPGEGRVTIPLITPADTGDYFYVQLVTQPFVDTSLTSFSISCSKKSDNVVQSWQDGTEWTNVSSTFSTLGFGTPSSVEVYAKRQGSNLLYRGRFTSGNPTVDTAKIYLPWGILTSNTSSITKLDGTLNRNLVTNDAGFVPLNIGSRNYISLGRVYNAAPLTEVTGNAVFGVTEVQTFSFTIPIQGWSSTPTLLALPTSKENVFSARISSTGAITSQNVSWISSVTKNATGDYTVNFNTGVTGFTVAPSVTIAPDNAGVNDKAFSYNTLTTSAIGVKTYSSSAVATDSAFNIVLQKQSPDYTAPGVFISNLNPDGFNRTSGTTGLVDNFSFSYGTTNATTVCSASPCSYLDQIGNYVTSVARDALGTYTANFSKTFSKLKCSMTLISASVFPVYNGTVSCSNCSTLSFYSQKAVSDFAKLDSYGSILCQGY